MRVEITQQTDFCDALFDSGAYGLASEAQGFLAAIIASLQH